MADGRWLMANVLGYLLSAIRYLPFAICHWMKMPTGVLLMAYGGPNSLDEGEPYLLDVRGGRPTAPELVAEVRQRYAQIGGRSPLLELTQRQAGALQRV